MGLPPNVPTINLEVEWSDTDWWVSHAMWFLNLTQKQVGSWMGWHESLLISSFTCLSGTNLSLPLTWIKLHDDGNFGIKGDLSMPRLLKRWLLSKTYCCISSQIFCCRLPAKLSAVCKCRFHSKRPCWLQLFYLPCPPCHCILSFVFPLLRILWLGLSCTATAVLL